MCGIAGIISPDPSVVTLSRVQLMTDALYHRGPDGAGAWMNSTHNIAFGHRRLSIIDLSNKGAQPMHYSERYTIVYNGEIYNFIELREDLRARGYVFTSSCDTEVVLAMYEQYKEHCVDHFDGMFSFAIWDELEQTFFAARDRFGEKPFYYHWDKDLQTLHFASEIKSFWAAGLPKEIDNKMVYAFITLGFTQNSSHPSQTFFRNIKKLPPASCIIYKIREDVFKIRKYWHIDIANKAKLLPGDAIERFSDMLIQSVTRRLRSDVPVGTCLSGGLDSSSIVALINKIKGLSLGSGNGIHTFSAIFPGFEKDESPYISEVQARFKTPGHIVEPDTAGLIADFEKMAYYQDEPFPSTSTYAQWKVFELAKEQGVKVLLDGQGADEILAGYSKYYHWFWQELLREKGYSAMRKEKTMAALPGVSDSWGLKNHVAAYFPNAAAKALRGKAIIDQKKVKDISQDFYRANADESFLQKPTVRTLSDILHFNTFNTGLEELLRFADRCSMAHSREVRLPFLSHELVEFVFSLNSDMKIREGFTKWILRASMKEELPQSIVWRKDKVGFETPQKKWMNDQGVKELIREGKRKLQQQGILDKTALDNHDLDRDWRYLTTSVMFNT